jgi:hypothetical protein
VPVLDFTVLINAILFSPQYIHKLSFSSSLRLEVHRPFTRSPTPIYPYPCILLRLPQLNPQTSLRLSTPSEEVVGASWGHPIHPITSRACPTADCARQHAYIRSSTIASGPLSVARNEIDACRSTFMVRVFALFFSLIVYLHHS